MSYDDDTNCLYWWVKLSFLVMVKVIANVMVIIMVIIMGLVKGKGIFRFMDMVSVRVRIMERVAMKMLILYTGTMSLESRSWARSRVWSWSWSRSWSWSGVWSWSLSWRLSR